MSIRSFFIIAVMLISGSAWAEWELQQSPDGHWIVTRNSEQHQFIVGGQGEDMQFLLILMVPEQLAILPEEVIVSIDTGPRLTQQLTLLEQQPNGMLFRLEFAGADKSSFIRRMIAGVKLRLDFGEKAGGDENLHFSLLGFTVEYNELLIANETGRLDPNWMLRQKKERELICYYAANLSVQALQKRIEGRTSEDTLKSLAPTGLAPVDDSMPSIVNWAYQLPTAELPVEPRAEKYGFFRRCMDGLAIEG